MAGNPFRRKQEPDQLPQLRSEGATKAFNDALQSVGISDTARRTPAVKKQVRIQTPPPLSPDSPDTLIRKVSNEGHTGSPPPQSPVDGVAAPDDPFSKQFAHEIIESQSKEAIDNTRRNSATGAMPPPPASAMVLNPFQTTLATLEPGKAKDEVQMKKESQGSDGRALSSNHAWDVDAFTKMLMTGAAPPISLNKAHAVDAKKQSPASGPNPASYADLSSESSDDEESDGKPAGAPSMTPKTPPPVPKHRHGKSFQQSGPQTVSFAEFDAIPIANTEKTNSVSRSVSKESENPPSRQVSGSSSTHDTPAHPARTSSKTSENTKRSRSPPPIPTARRTSSLKYRDPHDAETSSINSVEPPSSPGLPKSAKAPPPPPSRRPGNRFSLPPDQTLNSEITSINSDNTSIAGDSIMSTDSSSTRQPATSTTIPSRNSSGSLPTATHMPPPPPPRRRRGSSKSSVEVPVSGENRRTSQESSRNVSGLSQVAETGEGKPRKDILADLSAFQAEVDALRAESMKRAS